MSKLDCKEVSVAVMHETIFINGIGQLGPTLTNQTTATSKGVKMTLQEPFLLLEVKDKVGTDVSVPIPLTNFKNLVLAK